MTLRAKDIMNPQPPTIAPDAPVEEAAKRLAEGGEDYLLVVDEEGRLLGILTENDLVDRERKLHLPTAIAVLDMVIPLGEKRFEEELARLRAKTAGELMSAPVRTIGPEATLDAIAEVFAEENIHHLPVVEGDEVLGVVSRHDLVKALARRG